MIKASVRDNPGLRNKFVRFAWTIVWGMLVRPIPRSIFNGWKLTLLKLFGARVHKTAVVYSSATIYLPSNLEMGEHAIIGSCVDCYNVDKISLGAFAMVSQKTYLCSASHDFTRNDMPLVSAPIIIEDHAWIAADVFVGMGVTVGQGAIVGARSSLFRDVEPWTVVGGNPARFIKKRLIEG